MLGKRSVSDDGISDHSSTAQTYPRKRVSIAVCRLRKTRCDAGKPACSFCAELNIKCVYKRPTDALRTESKSDELLQALKRLDRIEYSLEYIAKKIGVQEQPHIYDISSWKSSYTSNFVLGNGLVTPSTAPAVPTVKPNNKQHYACKIPNILYFKHPLPERSEWSWDVSELFFNDQMNDIARMHEDIGSLLQDPDFSDLQLWNLQQSFVQNVLKYFPIFDTETFSQHLQYARSIGYHKSAASSCLALLVFAIGSIATGQSLYSKTVHEIPGITYYARAISILDRLSGTTKELAILQCRILVSIFLCFAVRPMESWKNINQAAQDCILLLRANIHRDTTPAYRETFSRLYWTCFVIESELEACLEVSPSGLRRYSGSVPLPISRYEEDGMYFLLATVSLRKIMVEVLDAVGFNSTTTCATYNPAVALELKTQIDEWYQHLPDVLQFPLDNKPLHDSRKAYLRCSYYALVVLATWPFVIPLSHPPPTASTQPVKEAHVVHPPYGPTSHPSQEYVPTLRSQDSSQYHHHHYRPSPSPQSRHTPTPSAASPYPSNSPVIASDALPAHQRAAQICIDSCRAYLMHAEEILSTKSIVSHLVVRQYFAFIMVLILCFNGADEQSHMPGILEEKRYLERAMGSLRRWAIVPFVSVSLGEMKRVGKLRALDGGL